MGTVTPTTSVITVPATPKEVIFFSGSEMLVNSLILTRSKQGYILKEMSMAGQIIGGSRYDHIIVVMELY
jgi:hypothetical protein